MLRKGCGKMAMDNSSARTTEEESEHPPLSSCSQKTLIKNRKSGQLICYKTGQVYLLLTTSPLNIDKPGEQVRLYMNEKIILAATAP
jgi:hypothetical protein